MIIIKDIFGSIIVKTYLQHMLEITGKVLGAMTHVLSFCLVSCFCFLFIYFTDYTMFTLIASRHKPTVSSWIVDCAIALVLMYFGLNVFFNYFMTMLTDPGTPFNDDPELLNVQGSCSKCQLPKPRRAHHCSICNKCIYQMDHHCPWMWNCVGHFNRRYFVGFLTNLSVALLLIWIMNLTVDTRVKDKNQYIGLFDILIGVVFGVITAFAVFHWYLVLSGKTSLEVCDTDDQLYGLSAAERFEVVFGSQNYLTVFVPNLKQLKYDGIVWSKQEIY